MDLKLGQFYSINRFVNLIFEKGLNGKGLFESPSNRESKFSFFYGKNYDIDNHIEKTDKNGILLGKPTMRQGFLGDIRQKMTNRIYVDSRLIEIMDRLKSSEVSIDDFKSALDEFMGVSYASFSMCDGAKDTTETKRAELENARDNICKNIQTDIDRGALEQYCQNRNAELPENMTAVSLRLWLKEITIRIEKKTEELKNTKSTELMQKINRELRNLNRRKKDLEKKLEEMNEPLQIEEHFSFSEKVQELMEKLSVRVTGYYYLDMISNQDAIYTISQIEFDRDSVSDESMNFGAVWKKAESLSEIEKHFRVLEETEQVYRLWNPDSIDVKAVQELVKENQQLCMALDVRNDSVVICVKNNSCEDMLQGFDLLKKAEEHYGIFRREYEKIAKENKEKACALACLCISCCSGIDQGIKYLFSDWLLQIVSAFQEKNYSNLKELLLLQDWKFGEINEEQSEKACLYYIFSQILDLFSEEEKEQFGIAGKTAVEFYQNYYELYCKYEKTNNAKVNNFELNSCWCIYIGNCCLEMASSAISELGRHDDKIKDLVSIAEKDELSRKEALVFHGDLLEQGLVYGRDEKNKVKAFEYYLRSGTNKALSRAAILLKDLKNNGQYADFLICRGNMLTRQDPVKELLGKYTGNNMDIYNLYLQEKYSQEKKKTETELEDIVALLVKELEENDRDFKIAAEKQEQIVIVGFSEAARAYLASLNDTSFYGEVYLVDQNINEEIFNELKQAYKMLKGYASSVEQLINHQRLVVYNLIDVCRQLCSASIIHGNAVDAFQLRYLILEEDKNDNLEHTLKIFDLTQKFQMQYDILFEKIGKTSSCKMQDAFKLSEHVEAIIDTDSEEMEIYIDNVQKKSQRFYLPVRYVNYVDEVSKYLLWKKPLFLPLLNQNRKEDRTLTIVLMGHDKTVIPTIKNIVSVSCFGTEESHSGPRVSMELAEERQKTLQQRIFEQRINLLIVDEKAAEIEDQIRYEAPELFSGKDYGLCNIKFYPVDVKTSTFSALFKRRGRQYMGNKDKYLWELAVEIGYGDYFICALEQDEENMKLGRKIREMLLANSETFDYMPIITALCRNSLYAKRADEYYEGNNSIVRGHWQSDYRIYGYGMFADLYSVENLDENVVHKLALNTHCSYYNRGWRGENEAKKSYYSSAYNRNSSIMAALYSVYRCYSLGIFEKGEEWEEKDLWGNCVIDHTVMNTTLKQPEQITRLAIQEHIRWCGHLIIRSWTPGLGKTQMENYLKAGVTKHQMDIGKVHPYLGTWEELGERKELNEQMFETVFKAFEKCIGLGERQENDSLFYLVSNVLRPYLLALKAKLTGDNELDVAKRTDNILAELKDFERLYSQNEAAGVKFAEGIDEKNYQEYQTVRFINESIREWLCECERIMAEIEKREYIQNPVEFYHIAGRLNSELANKYQRCKEQLERIQMKDTDDKINCLFVVDEWLGNGKVAQNRKVLTVMEKITSRLSGVLISINAIIEGAEGTGIQGETDALMWKYQPQRVSKLSIKETNRNIIRDSFVRINELAHDYIKEHEYKDGSVERQ